MTPAFAAAVAAPVVLQSETKSKVRPCSFVPFETHAERYDWFS